MSRLIRQLLFMFGPLIFRQATKLWRNKNKQQGYNTPDRQVNQPRAERNRRPEPAPEATKVEPKLSEEERNFRLEEEDIMLEKQDLKHINKKYDSEMDDLIERS